MGNKKKKKKQNVKNKLSEEATDELVALEAIYSQDFQAGQPNGGFCLRVVPHPGEVAANQCAVTLCITYPAHYPRQPVQLYLQHAVGLHGSQVKVLAGKLEAVAAEHAAAGEVCVFNLVELCQEVLREINDTCSGATQDVEEGQHREGGVSRGPPVVAPLVAGLYTAGGLFDEPHEAGMWFPADRVPQTSPATPSLPLPKGPGPVVAAQSPFRSHPSTEQAVEAGAATAAITSGGPLATANLPAGSLGNVLSATVASLVHSIGAVTRAVGAVALPRPVRRLLASAGSSAGLSRAATESGASSDADEEGSMASWTYNEGLDRQQLRKDLLTGRLVQLLGQQHSATLPGMAEQLQSKGLIPRWVASCLANNQQLFDKAFAAAFREDMGQPSAGAAINTPIGTSAATAAVSDTSKSQAPLLTHIFQPTLQTDGLALPPERAASNSLSSNAVRRYGGIADSWCDLVGGTSLSRYETDFQELRKLGAGGFGLVVAAINRLDGRQYAIKKIRVDQRQPAAYARILREVSTLSRLSSPHVVRYYQAWCEFVHQAAAPAEDSELEGWTTESTGTTDRRMNASASLPPCPGKGNAPTSRSILIGSKSLLQPVLEQSAEGVGSPSPSPAPSPLRHLTPQSSQPLSDSSAARLSPPAGPYQIPGGAAETAAAPPASLSESTSTDTTPEASHATSSTTGDLSRPTDAQALPDSAFGHFWGPTGSFSGLQPAVVGSSTSDLFGPAEWADKSYCGSQQGGSGLGTQTSSGMQGAGKQSTGESNSSGVRGKEGGQRSGMLHEMLFIQMEYCPRTLRELLDSGPLDKDLAWKVLRQIAQGLAHIHQQGIIHRDLKPANVFFDSKGDVKLGDLGLAKFTTGNGTEDEEGVSVEGSLRMPGQSSQQGESSGVMGTSFYISPEIRNAWASYDAKVDMYSLGVLAFELFHPFTTGMERIKALEQLAYKGVVPPHWAKVHGQEASLVQWLLSSNPAERPTARELLLSPLLPPSLGDEALRDVLRSMEEDPTTLETVLEHMFSRNVREGQSLSNAEAHGTTAGEPDFGTAMECEMAVRQAISEACARHGAIPIRGTQWAATGGELQAPPGAVRAMLPNGQQLWLPYDLRRPLVSWLRQAVQQGGQHVTEVGLRRYQITPVYRSALGQRLPRSFLQADVDFIYPAPASTNDRSLELSHILDAQVVKTVLDVMSLLPAELGSLELRLGHSAVTSACLAHIDLPAEVTSSAARLLSTALAASPTDVAGRNRAWPGVKAGMEGLGLTRSHIARSRQVALHLPGLFEEALDRTRSFMQEWGTASQGSVMTALSSLGFLVEVLQEWGVPEEAILLEPLLLPQAEYFSGFLFQMHVVMSHHEQGPGSRSCPLVAIGGRYDALLRGALAPRGSQGPRAAGGPSASGGPLATLHAVGATINADRLIAALSDFEQRRNAYTDGRSVLLQLPRSCQADVLVCGKSSSSLLKERLQLLNTLWAAGIKAELASDTTGNMTSHYRYATLQHITWLLVLADNQEWRASNSVRLKNVKKGNELLLGIEEIPAFLSTQLLSHTPVPASRPPQPAKRTDSRDDSDSGLHPEAGGPSGGPPWARRRKGKPP